MKHVFQELNGISKTAAPEDQTQVPGITDMPTGGSPGANLPPGAGPAIPPDQAGIPQGGGAWVGPRTGSFPNRRTSVNMDDDNSVMSGAIDSVIREYSYLSEMPMEPRIVEKGDVVVGDIMIATPDGAEVSIPFIAKEGHLEPPIAVVIDEEYYAIPNTESGFSELMGGTPTLGMPAAKTQRDSQMQENLAKGPDLNAQADSLYNNRRAVIGEMPKQASFMKSISGTPFGRKVHDLLDIPVSVIQYERVPFGVMEKTASKGSNFSPSTRKIPLSAVPEELLERLSDRSCVTKVYDAERFNADLEKTAATAVKLYSTDELKPGMGVKARYDGERFSMRVLKQIGWGSTDPEELVLLSSRGSFMRVDGGGDKRWVAARPPNISMGSVKDMWKHPGKRMMVVAGSNKVYRPLGIVKKGIVYTGSYFSSSSIMDSDKDKFCDVVVSSTVVEPQLSGAKLYLPEDAKVIYMSDKDCYVDTSIEKVASNFYPGKKVSIERVRDGFVLQGNPVQDAAYNDTPIESQVLPFSDAVFILGALGVPEARAISKVASAEKGPQDILVAKAIKTIEDNISVDLGFTKLAALLPEDQGDAMLGLQMMGQETLQMFVENLSEVYRLADDLAKLTVAAQIGLDPIDPTIAYTATKNVLKVADQLSELAATQDGVS